VRARHLALVVLVLAGTQADDVRAQSEASVSGRVVGVDAPNGIVNATAELVGHGAVLTTPEGVFRFDGVPLREYVLRVSALGYDTVARFLNVQANVVLNVELQIAPLQLDSLLVEAREIDFDGRVMDPERDTPVMDALVLTDQGHEEWSNQRGHFDLDDVLESVPIRMRVRAFGYLPVDTMLVPDDDGRHDIDLMKDTLVERLIAVQTRRIEQRAGEHLYEYRAPFDRDVLASYSSSSNVASIMESKYPLNILQRVVCILVDERHIQTDHERRSVLLNMFPQEIERMELLEFAIEGGRRAFMLRIYTRSFFQQMIARDLPLRRPAIHAFTRICT
jgi:hypothetical protein